MVSGTSGGENLLLFVCYDVHVGLVVLAGGKLQDKSIIGEKFASSMFVCSEIKCEVIGCLFVD